MNLVLHVDQRVEYNTKRNEDDEEGAVSVVSSIIPGSLVVGVSHVIQHYGGVPEDSHHSGEQTGEQG